MTGGRESSDAQGSTAKPGNGNPEQPTPAPSHKAISPSSVARWKKLPRETKQQVLNDFKNWRGALIRMINTGSQIELPVGGARYTLPPDLVRVVWQTTIRQRAQMLLQEGAATQEQAMVDAIASLQTEVAEAAQREVDATNEAEKRAAEKLVQMREDLVRERDQSGGDSEQVGGTDGDSSEGA